MITRRVRWAGRMWRVATDDFALPSGCMIVLHVIRMAFLVALILTAGTASCGDASVVDVFIFGSLGIFVGAAGADAGLLCQTCAGSLPESGRRGRVSTYLTIRAVFFVLEFASVFFGFAMVYNGIPTCALDEDDMNTDLILTWFMIIFGLQELVAFLLGIWLAWDPNGARRMRGVIDTERSYYRTCSWMFCCVRNRDDNALQFIAQSLSSFMERVENDPPSASDILAGLALVRLKQTRLGKQLSSELDCAADLAVSMHCGHSKYGTTPEEVSLIQDAAHYMQHAHAIYGWMLYVRSNIACGLCKLVGQCGCVCCSGCHKNWGRTDHSTCLRANHTALNKHLTDFSAEKARATGNHLELNGCEVVYSCQWEGVFSSPFAVIVDRHKSSIVVAIRGTLSLADALQDAYAAPATLQSVFGDERLSPELRNPRYMAHVAMLKGALLIKQRLDDERVLEDLFAEEALSSFKLVVTGHSLGAGLAACTALLLHKDYKDKLSCFPMSPPGGLFTPDLAEAVSPFTTSVILGIDLVPRLSVKTLHLLRDQVIRYFPQCKVNKWTLYTKFWNTNSYAQVFGSNELSVESVLKAERTGSMVASEARAASKKRGLGGGMDSPYGAAVGGGTPRDGAAVAAAVDEVVLDMDVRGGDEETKGGEVETKRGPTQVEGAKASTALLSKSTFTKDQLTLLPPGRLIHLVRSKVNRRCCGCSGEEFQAMTPRRRFFEQVIVGPRMMLDHMPDRVLEHLTRVADALAQRGPSASAGRRAVAARSSAGVHTGAVV